MKKIVAALVLALTVSAVVGCGSASPTKAVPAPTTK
jgi:predicted small lipoprotein YifL